LLKLYRAGGKMLDIGCGTGQVIASIESDIESQIDGADLDETLLKQGQKIKGDYFVLNVFDNVPELHEKYDSILLLDVIEHVDQDADFLRHCAKFIKPGGLIFINVPAFNSVFSVYDELVGHQRRYTKATKARLAKKSGLKLLTQHYWGFLLLPLLLVRKAILLFTPKEKIIKRGFQEPSKLIGSVLDAICALEYKSGLSRLSPGSSLLSVLQKPN